MYVEELILKLDVNSFNVFSFDHDVISSLSLRISHGNHLTEKQRNLALKIIKKYQKKLSNDLKFDVLKFLENPVFKYPAKINSFPRSISVEFNPTPAIKVKFPYDSKLVESIRDYKIKKFSISNSIQWSNDQSWKFALIEEHIAWLSEWIKDKNFQVDDTFRSLSEKVIAVSNIIESYIPYIDYENSKFVYKNVYHGIPQPNSNDLLEVLVNSRRYGLTNWSDPVSKMIEEKNYNENIINFLYKSNCDILVNDSKIITLEDLNPLISVSGQVLFVIPGGQENEILKLIHNFLISHGHDNKSMSVLFRLSKPSKYADAFNAYIKDNNLNNPLEENTKFVFISKKVPKPLLEKIKYFDLVLQFSTQTAHYRLKNYLNNQPNVILTNVDRSLLIKNRSAEFISSFDLLI